MTDLRDEIRRLLECNYGVNPSFLSDPQTSFTDLGLDSLDVAGLVLEIEKLVGRSLDIRQMRDIRTVGDFLRQLESAGSPAAAL